MPPTGADALGDLPEVSITAREPERCGGAAPVADTKLGQMQGHLRIIAGGKSMSFKMWSFLKVCRHGGGKRPDFGLPAKKYGSWRTARCKDAAERDTKGSEFHSRL